MWSLDTDRMAASFNNSLEQVIAYLPTIVAAILVLVVGWIIAALLGAAASAIARRTGVTNRLRRWHESERAGQGERAPNLDNAIGKGVFYLAMVFVLVAFFQTLGLTMVTTPLNQFLNQFFAYLPNLIGAAVLVAVAWGVAVLLRFAVRRGVEMTRIDRRLERHAAVAEDSHPPLAKSVADAAYWLTFLLFLPAILDALNLPGLLTPVQSMVGEVLDFLPNLLAAAVVLGVGWLFARIIERVVTSLLTSVGVDQFGEQMGINRVLGRASLSRAIGLVVYVLVFLPVLVAALNALQIEAVTAPASLMLTQVLAALPRIFAAFLVLAVAYVVGRVLGDLTTRVLASFGFDSLPAKLGMPRTTAELRRSPSQIAGGLVLVAVMLLAIMQAMPFLGFEPLTALMAQFLIFAGQVLVGLAIFAIGLYVARIAANAIRDADVPQAQLLAFLAQSGIIVLAGAMGLQNMGVGEGILLLAFGLFAGAIAVAAAVAFGIGGRDAAKDAVDRFYYNRLSSPPGDGGGAPMPRTEPGRRRLPEQEEQHRQPL